MSYRFHVRHARYSGVVSGRDRAAGLEPPPCCLFVQEREGFVCVTTYIVRAEIPTDVLKKIPDFWGMSIGIKARMFLRSLLSLSTECPSEGFEDDGSKLLRNPRTYIPNFAQFFLLESEIFNLPKVSQTAGGL